MVHRKLITTKSPDLKGNEKECKQCHEVKDMKEFPKRGNHRLKTCDTCYKDNKNYKSRLRYREDPEYRNNKLVIQERSRWRYRYNVEPETVIQTLIDQQNKCANLACGVEISLTAPKELVKPAVVDHNHVTGNFRALLCNRCNTVLGHLELNPELIKGLETYLKKYNH